MKLQPFCSKELADIQKKIFRRHHGITADILANQNTEIEFVVPYNWVKITTMEIHNLPEMMQADLSVHDNNEGTYSQTGISKYKLNQFGFDVNLSKNYYKDHSEYDADLYLGMIVKLTIKNTTELTCKIGINFTLHEIV